jgi:hypothetical protein
MARDDCIHGNNFNQEHTVNVPDKDQVAAGQRAAFKPYHARTVPKRAKLDQTKGPITPPTTMMLRNIPNQYTQSALREELHDAGFAGLYNFFYLPMDIQNHTNVGYAFVNFLEPDGATHFFTAFSEFRFKRIRSRKTGAVSPAYIQGLEKNLQHFQDKAVKYARNGQYRPIVILGGQLYDVDEALAELSTGRTDEVCKAKNRSTPVQQTERESQLPPWLCMNQLEIDNAPTSPDRVARGLGRHGPVGSGLSKPTKATGQHYCLTGYVCADMEPCYIQPGVCIGDSPSNMRPPPGLESPFEESWRPGLLPSQDLTISLSDALEAKLEYPSLQKLSLDMSTKNLPAYTEAYDANAPTPRTNVSLLAGCYGERADGGSSVSSDENLP